MKAQKEKLRVVIYTDNHKIKGEVHLYENSRLTDILNADTATRDFLPVTNAHVADLRSGAIQEVSFLSVNRHIIEMVMEDDESLALNKAKDLISKRRFSDATHYADRAVKAAPENAEAHYVFGFCLAKSGDTVHAKAEFERCLTLSPDLEIIQRAEEMLKAIP